jgi:hypothetical protein
MDLEISDQLYYWSGLVSGASGAYDNKLVPSLVLTLTTGALATSLRGRLCSSKRGNSVTERIPNAIAHTVVDALHLVSGVVTGGLLTLASSQWNQGNRVKAINATVVSLAFVFASSCATMYARQLANKTNQEQNA